MGYVWERASERRDGAWTVTRREENAKTLRKLNASEISVISRGKRDLAYEIADQKRGNFIQINFSSIPKRIENFSSSLKFDSNVLRFLVLNKTNNVKNF